MLEMLRFLKALKGNAKTCLVLDPLWTTPFNLYLPFATLYMFSLGLDDVEIGVLLSVGMFFQFVMALLGGVVTDKFGRRRVVLFADFVAWNIPTLLWAFAQDFWWFLAAAMVNSVFQIGVVAFECTYLDDTKEHHLQRLINWFHILWLFSVFSALISGFFVERFSLVPVMRVLYLVAFVSMGIRMIILYFRLKETSIGRQRMEATKDKSILQLLSGYKEVFLFIMRNRAMRRLLVLLPIVQIFMMVTGTFFALYATQNLGLGDYVLAYFPAARSGVALLFYFFIQNHLGRFKIQHLMGTGLALYVAAHILLLSAPPQNLVWLGAYALMDAWAAALFLPRLDKVVFSSIDANERARCRALINVIVLAITSPFGFLAGFLSDIDRRLPFVMNIILFIILIAFLLQKPKDRGSSAPTAPANS